MERLAAAENITAGLLLLHSLIWGARCGHKNFNRWLKDALVKQGMFTQHTEILMKAVSDAVNTLKYDISNAKTCIIALTPDIKKGNCHYCINTILDFIFQLKHILEQLSFCSLWISLF